ncbi:MAG: peptidoglycan DD-metalloendopeptidase family protein [Gemmatimonadetes bacterium]|nr:peptidoglycan DD-metalloendopeptidase family protein [Gemmatimonadota bacterium]
MASGKRFTILLIPDEADSKTHVVRISYRTLRVVSLVAGVAALFLIAVSASWWYFAAETARVMALESEVERLRSENARAVELAAELARLERQYGKVREILGGDIVPAQATPTLPPDAEDAGARAGDEPGPSGIPTAWPLTRPGFITQSVGPGSGGREHPGLDIAVARDTYVRASGGGVVRSVGHDSIYGLYVVVDHGAGYETMYGHASRLFVAAGDSVERNEVIALSGNTGQSTAPHLHFEIRRNGRAIDPLAFLRRGG